jgi:hypothetical protein
MGVLGKSIRAQAAQEWKVELEIAERNLMGKVLYKSCLSDP